MRDWVFGVPVWMKSTLRVSMCPSQLLVQRCHDNPTVWQQIGTTSAKIYNKFVKQILGTYEHSRPPISRVQNLI